MDDLPKAYNPKDVENKWYKFWEEKKFFSADPNSPKPKFSIVIPPPNVTGVLHMGHALVNTIQDTLIRWKRMLGYEALWVPGVDHAGIATQTVVEQALIKNEGKRRKDYPREEFLSHVWAWKEKNEHSIISQLKAIGSSCDWDRKRFTMDAGCNKAVKKTFKMLYDADLIYQGDYLVNWDPITQTALADDEVEYEERESSLWFFRYPIKDSDEFVQIATTRPETMLGDTAVAVSPKDERYAHLIGKTVLLPLMNREIPIIADNHVDPEFGTGVVKITPAHDPNDNQMGLDHHLEFINIMTPDGKINENGGKFQGLTMKDAREAVVEEMQKMNLVEKITPHLNRVGISYRSKATIEPYMSKQWFVRTSAFSKKMRETVESGKVKLIPKNWESTYFHWIDNLRDWCISRQLWWGHRIPIWYNKNDPSNIICYDGDDLPEQVKENPDDWYQDEDVLDTWFSSALWPFSAMGWPDKTPEFENFYPNSVLVTAHDILFFWVARMIMMGEYVTHTPPFPEVFLHGLIYGKSYWKTSPEGHISYITGDERKEYDLGKPLPKEIQFKWEKMSKSKGNVIDPLEIIDEYGTDAMRMALCYGAPQSREIDLDRRKFEDFKNFANKIWNGARFIFMNLGTAEEFSEGLNEELLDLEDRWILSSLNSTIQEVNEALSAYTFDQAAHKAYNFYWNDFCSYYLEIVKPVLFGKVKTEEHKKNKQRILTIVLCNAMRLIHPMAPFVTEEIFSLLKKQMEGISGGSDPYTKETAEALAKEACMVAPYPQAREHDIDQGINHTFDFVGKVIYSIRNIRGEMQIPPSKVTDLYVVSNHENDNFQSLQKNSEIVKALVRIENLHFSANEPELKLASTAMLNGLKLMIPMPEDMLRIEKTRLQKEIEKLSAKQDSIKKQLSNPSFVERAPKELVEKQKMTLKQTEIEIEEMNQKLSKI